MLLWAPLRRSHSFTHSLGHADKAPSLLAEEDKAAVRELIVEGIVRAPHSVRVQLGECVRAMIYCDYPEKWPQLLQQVYVLLTSQVRAVALVGARAGPGANHVWCTPERGMSAIAHSGGRRF